MPTMDCSRIYIQEADGLPSAIYTPPEGIDFYFRAHRAPALIRRVMFEVRFEGSNAIPQGSVVSNLKLNFYITTGMGGPTNQYKFLYLGVLNNLKSGPGQVNDIVGSTPYTDYKIHRWMSGEDLNSIGASTGFTHNHVNGLSEPGPTTVTGGHLPQDSACYIYRFTEAGNLGANSWHESRNIAGALQPLVDHPDWDSDDQYVSILGFWASHDYRATPGNWTWYMDNLHEDLDWASGDSGFGTADVDVPLADYDSNSMLLRIQNTPWVEFDAAPPTMSLTATDTTSSGNVKLKPSLNIGRWLGADTTQAGEATGGFAATWTFGRGDRSPNKTYGQMPVNASWVSPNERVEIGAWRGSNGERLALKNVIHPVGTYTGFGWNSYYWNPEKPNNTTLHTWSLRFYYLAFYSSVYEQTFFETWDKGIRKDWFQWYREGSPHTYPDASVRWGYDGGTTAYSGWAGPLGVWHRVEMQVSEFASPKSVVRVYVGENTTPLYTWERDPNSVSIDFLRFQNGIDNVLFNVASAHYGDIEWWDDYDLGGQFSQDATDPTGYPYVAPEYEWYFYDGTDVVELEDMGVLRSIASNGTTPTFTHEGISESRIEWASQLNGTPGASVEVALDDTEKFSSLSIGGAGSYVRYDDTVVPTDFNQSIKHFVDTANGDYAAATTTQFNEPLIGSDKLFLRQYIYLNEDLDIANNVGWMHILRVSDFGGEAIFSIKLNYVHDLYMVDGEAGTGEIFVNIEENRWYRLEVFFDTGVNTALTRDTVQIRLFDDTNTLIATLAKSNTINTATAFQVTWGPQLAFGEQSRTTANSTFTGTIYTAGHAIDTLDWIGGSPSDGGYEPEIQFGSTEASLITYRGIYPQNGPEGDIGAAYYEGNNPGADAGRISYGIGTGNTANRDMEFYHPEGDPPEEGWPCVFYVHGGAWADGDANDIYLGGLIYFLLQQGFAIFSIEYQLADGVAFLNDYPGGGAPNPPSYSLGDNTAGRFPTFILDTKQAMHWVKNNASAAPYNVDMDRIVGMAYSAGTFNLLGAMATKDLTDDGASVTYDWTLAGNSGAPYYYDDEGEGDPDILQCVYLFGPLCNLRKAVDFEYQNGTGYYIWASWGNGGGFLENLVRNSYADRTEWYNDIAYNHLENWASITPSNLKPLGMNIGDLDWFILSDPHKMYPEYSQFKEFEDSYNNGSVTAEFDPHVASMHHDYLQHEVNYDHLLTFLGKHL